jgi:hypothetical protein
MDVEKILGSEQLGGRVTRDSQFQFASGNTAPVIRYFDQFPARIRNRDRHMFCSGIERVLKQLLHNRRGPLDNLTGRDL